ncbi:MAG: hypothetical protein NWF05_01015 [Candidatus Bathyarchaeota archaeon]|nr:hypothetical protein [Candidatus Bathyarchaeota archaeon]
MEKHQKKFHFQEINWIICFPADGNTGKYRDYDVMLVEVKKSHARKAKLGEILDESKIDQNYPHTVGYFKACSGEAAAFMPEYLELREIRTVEEFWAFLNALNI